MFCFVFHQGLFFCDLFFLTYERSHWPGLCFRAAGGIRQELLQEAWKFWLQDHLARGGSTPPGNLPRGAGGAEDFWQRRSSKATGG